MNRFTNRLADIRERCAVLEPARLEEFDREMSVTAHEHFTFQETQARSHAAGVLSMEEALVIYNALGEHGSSSNGGWAKGTDTATKVLVTLAMGELVGKRLAA